jgi:hypothetical protein
MWQWKQQTQRGMADEAEREGRAGLAALADGDLTAAQRGLSRSAQLLAQLESPLENQQVYLQAARETDIVASLPGKSMQQILREAADSSDSVSVLRDRSFLYEGELVVDEDGRPAPVTAGSLGNDLVVVDLASLPILDRAEHSHGARILIGFKMKLLSKGPGGWELEVEPSSAAWITHPKLLKYLGLSEESTKRTAERQRERLGLPTW